MSEKMLLKRRGRVSIAHPLQVRPVRFRHDQLIALSELAEVQGSNLSQLIREAVDEYLIQDATG